MGRWGGAGAQNSQAVLTLSAVREIRRRFASGQATLAELAAEFHCSVRTIRRVVAGETYRQS
jgi:AraC-like DNA-binding protein